MGADSVVVPPPALDDNLGFPERVKYLAVEQLVTEPVLVMAGTAPLTAEAA
jgi:hypothetical protein